MSKFSKKRRWGRAYTPSGMGMASRGSRGTSGRCHQGIGQCCCGLFGRICTTHAYITQRLATTLQLWFVRTADKPLQDLCELVKLVNSARCTASAPHLAADSQEDLRKQAASCELRALHASQLPAEKQTSGPDLALLRAPVSPAHPEHAIISQALGRVPQRTAQCLPQCGQRLSGQLQGRHALHERCLITGGWMTAGRRGNAQLHGLVPVPCSCQALSTNLTCLG